MNDFDDGTSETSNDKPLTVVYSTKPEDHDMEYSFQSSENSSTVASDSSSENETYDTVLTEHTDKKCEASTLETSRKDTFLAELLNIDFESMNVLEKKVFDQFLKKTYVSGPKSRTKDTDYNAKESLYQKYLFRLKRKSFLIKFKMYKPGPRSLTKDAEYDKMVKTFLN